MIRTKKLFLALLTAIVCAALAGAVLLFGAEPLSARADQDSTHDTVFGTEHDQDGVTALDTETTITAGGKYYLDGNITRNIEISSGTVELCLNGHMLTGTGEGYVITVKNSATLIMHDCSGDKSGTVKCGDAQSGCVSTDGAFIMKGGTITGNNSSGNGVYSSSGTSSMSGGTITGCNVGVYLQGGTFTMTDGTITGNKTGVHLNMNFEVSGTPKVINNDKNVLLIRNKYIVVVGKLEVGAEIGVTHYTENGLGQITSSYNSNNNGTAPSAYFKADNDAFAISLVNNEAYIVPKDAAQYVEEELNKYADKKLEESKLSKEEQEKLEEDIQEAITAAKEKVSSEDVDKVLEDAQKEIDALIEQAENEAADNKKEEVKKEVESQLENYFEEQFKDSGLTAEDKKELEERIAGVIDKAKGKIEQGEDADQVLEEAKKEIDELLSDKSNGGSDNEGNGGNGGNGSGNGDNTHGGEGNKPEPDTSNERLLYVVIALSVILVIDVGILIGQLVRRKKNGAGIADEGGNE